MMETILKELFDINYYPPWSDDTRPEETETFLKLREATLSLKPNPKYYFRSETFNCVLCMLTIQVLRDYQHGIKGFSSVSNELTKKVEYLTWEEVCVLSIYFGIYSNLKPDDADDNYFLTADANERVNYNTVCSQLVKFLTKELEIEEARLCGYLKYGLPKDFWYELYGAVDDYNKEKVDNILLSIL
jgi:hypothetical protein